MPPTGRRRGRKDLEAANSDIQTPEAASTPSRKRRKVNGAEKASKTAVQRAASHESDATIENADEGHANSFEMDENALAEECIRHLHVSTAPRVNVSIDYNNDIVDKHAKAYAKIAGRQWTYYVCNTHVTIGRPNAKQERTKRDRSSTTADPAGGQESNEEFKIDIDLGPDQQVSRCHAQIEYSPEAEQWVIYCNGRNGLTLDDDRLERGQTKYLRSGAVICIMGTMMMFILPTETPRVHPHVKKLLLEGDEEEEEDADEPHPEPPHSASNGRAGRQSNSGYQPSSATKGQTSARSTQHTMAASSSQNQPGTPSHSQPQVKSNKQSPLYSRGLMLESTEEIDYSLDSAKDIKPPFSYAQMIGQAILNSPEENATLSKIYEYIREKFAFFRHNGAGWQNSIRHNLSLSKSFEKIPRRTDEPGKGMKWRIVDEFRDEFVKKTMVQSFRKQAQGSARSGPNSPANLSAGGPAAQTERLMGALGDRGSPNLKSSPATGRSTTPPLQPYPYPTANESFTPDRGPNRPSTLRTSNLPPGSNAYSANSVEFATPGRVPTFAPNSVGPAQRAAFNYSDGTGSPSGGLFDVGGNGMFTPLVNRSKPTVLPQPSTVKVPSHYAKDLFSSPAPFWKYIDMGSTPARPPPNLDFSPTKLEIKGESEEKDEIDEAIDEDEGDSELRDGDKAEPEAVKKRPSTSASAEAKEEPPAAPVQPSSPPAVEPLEDEDCADEPDASPTRSVSRPGSRANIGAAGLKAIAPKVLSSIPILPPPAQPAFGKPLNMRDMGPAINPYTIAKKDTGVDDEEEGIDLAKGFQSIGGYHRIRYAQNVNGVSQ